MCVCVCVCVCVCEMGVGSSNFCRQMSLPYHHYNHESSSYVVCNFSHCTEPYPLISKLSVVTVIDQRMLIQTENWPQCQDLSPYKVRGTF